MMHKIGTTAGEIWQFLAAQKEPVSIIKIKTQLSLPNSIVYLAIGWLARENKIHIEQKDNTFFISLQK